MSQLSNRIRKAREDRGLTKATVARSLGINPSAVVQWEREGGTSPSSTHLAKLAKLLDVAYEWLATGRGVSRVISGRETPAVDMSVFAQTLFEERLLELSRHLPLRSQEPLLQFLHATTNSPAASKQRKRSAS